MSTVKKAACQAFMYLVELVVILLSVFPILWVVMSAFKTNGEILTSPLDVYKRQGCTSSRSEGLCGRFGTGRSPLDAGGRHAGLHLLLGEHIRCV